MRKTVLITLVSLLAVFGSAAAWHGLSGAENITGSFQLLDREPDQKSPPRSGGVESVKWRFENGETVEGRMARRNFSPGTYNVTLIVEKTDGKRKTYQKTLKVEK